MPELLDYFKARQESMLELLTGQRLESPIVQQSIWVR